jgi:hypothetical protein
MQAVLSQITLATVVEYTDGSAGAHVVEAGALLTAAVGLTSPTKTHDYSLRVHTKPPIGHTMTLVDNLSSPTDDITLDSVGHLSNFLSFAATGDVKYMKSIQIPAGEWGSLSEIVIKPKKGQSLKAMVIVLNGSTLAGGFFMRRDDKELVIDFRKLTYTAGNALTTQIQLFNELIEGIKDTGVVAGTDLYMGAGMPDYFDITFEFNSWADDLFDNRSIVVSLTAGLTASAIQKAVMEYIVTSPMISALLNGLGVSLTSFAIGYGGALYVANSYEIIDADEYLREQAAEDIKEMLTDPVSIASLLGLGAVGAVGSIRSLGPELSNQVRLGTSVLAGVGATVFYNTILKIMDNQKIEYIPG